MPGGPATDTLATIKSMCPNAMVMGCGGNFETSNPGYTVRTDLFNFNGTIYDFEVTNCAQDGEHDDQNAQKTGQHMVQNGDQNHDQCGDNSGQNERY